MTTSIKNKHPLDEQDVLDIKRMRVPNSSRLKGDILNVTQQLPQYTEQPGGAQVYRFAALLRKINVASGIKYVAPIAAGFAVIALSLSFWLPTQNDLLVVDSLETLSVEQLAEEIAWQDLMLLQDELAFAGL